MEKKDCLILFGLLAFIVIVGWMCLRGSKQKNVPSLPLVGQTSLPQDDAMPYDPQNDNGPMNLQHTPPASTGGPQYLRNPPVEEQDPQFNKIQQQYGGQDPRTNSLGVGEGLSQEHQAYNYL